MILDKVLCGVLDQGRGCLLVYEKPEADVRVFSFLSPSRSPPSVAFPLSPPAIHFAFRIVFNIRNPTPIHLACIFSFVCPQQNTYGAAIETLAQVGKVVESLYAKVSSLFSLLRRHSAALAFSLFLGF